MRARFFLLIFSVLIGTTIGAVLIYGQSLRSERLAHIDAQLRSTASSLVDSELGTLRRVDFDRIERVLSQELGEERIGKLFVIRNLKGEILFQSTSARLLLLNDIPRSPTWLTIRAKRKYVRVLNLKLPQINDRILQVGLVLDEQLIYPPYWSSPSYYMVAFALVVGVLSTVFLSEVLMHPMNKLSKFVGHLGQMSSLSNEVPSLPRGLFPRYFPWQKDMGPKDEFLLLLEGLDALIAKINKNHRISRFWTYQMAHEIKTPLSIMRVEIERAESRKELPGELGVGLRRELDKVSELVTGFLSWAELENLNNVKNLHAAPISRVAKSIMERLGTQYPGRLQWALEQDFEVIANPQHLELVLQNLVLNALIYSGPGLPVVLGMSHRCFEVIDQGPGISQSVLQNLGTPFNRGERFQDDSQKSNGLGLAWVKSVCNLYRWDLHIRRDARGHVVSLTFPEN